MFSHLNDYSDDPFERLKGSIRLRMKEETIEDQIFGVVQDAFTRSLHTENIVLSRVERNRLLREVLKETLGDMLLDLSGKG